MKNGVLFENYLEWMDKPCWQAFATLTLPTPIPSEVRIGKLFRQWCRQSAKREGIRLGCFGVLNFLPRPHLHILMLGQSRHGKTLAEANLRLCERDWIARAEVKPLESKEASIKYLAKKNMIPGRYRTFGYGEDFLKKVKS